MLRTSKTVQRQIGAYKPLLDRFNHKKKLIATLRSCLFVLLCLVIISQILVSSTAYAASPELAKSNTQPAGNNYLLDRVITWADGSTERVQVAKSGFFYLNGKRNNLIGVFLAHQYLPSGQYGEFFLPSNMSLYEKELAYLKSIGIRLIHVELNYILWYTRTVEAEQKAYKDLLDLLYKYKMLIIPEYEVKWSFVYGNLTDTYFVCSINGTPDTIERSATRWIDTVSKYENVVGIVAENELDIPMKKTDGSFPGFIDQVYTARDVKVYMASLVKILRSKYSGPILHKLAGTTLIEPEIKKAALNATDLGGFDCYALSKNEMDMRLNELQTWLSNSGYPTTGWWCMEVNAGWNPVVLGKLDSGLIESIFNHGAAIAVLFPSNWSTEPTWQLFDNYGNPTPKLVELARDFNKLQVSIPETMVVASNTK